MRIFNDTLGIEVDIPDEPQRIVSLVSSATEAIFAMGCGNRVVGVSCYCSRYVASLTSPVVGDYLNVDWDLLKRLSPDLVLVTAGLQRHLGLKLAAKGYPTYAFPLPNSLFGILENFVLLGGLLNDIGAARHLCQKWEVHFSLLRQRKVSPPPWVYVELWFGRHQRTVGGLGFITHMIESVGGKNIFRDNPTPYFIPELAEIETRQPDIVVFFSEPEYPVDARVFMLKRGWDLWPQPPFLIESTIQKGMNMIHDGPSIMQTASWLDSRFKEWASQK